MTSCKRTIILLLAVFGLCLEVAANPVSRETAKAVAVKFMGTNDLVLSTTYSTDENVAALYVFNTSNGFVIIAADDCETPIIAYSHEGRFDPNRVPIQMEDYLQNFVEKIQYGIENHLEADDVTSMQWERAKDSGQLNNGKTTNAVAPLLTEKWNQGCLYNSLCPILENTPCNHAEVGCVAIAMGQIMHHWRYPATGWGSNSYSNNGTTLSADFGSTTYDWDHMPDSLSEYSSDIEIEAVATLLYHCGVSVNMFYNTSSSQASSMDVPKALIHYFCYSKRLHSERQAEYNNEEWLSLLKNCLDLQCPVYYSGSGNHGSHAFVCDGYDNNEMLHFNWGWGVANGYFTLGHLNPSGYDFNNNNYAILDIVPINDPCLVSSTAFPPSAGTIEGAGEYHIGAPCTLTATPAEDFEFFCWKRDGQILSNAPSFTFNVEDDTLMIEAHFSLHPASQITANQTIETNDPNSTSVNLSWSPDDTEWNLLKQFPIHGETGGVATDGQHIYVTYAAWNEPPFAFEKYTLDGELVEMFNLEGLPNALSLAYDGIDFYCNSMQTSKDLSELYRIDFENKRILDSTDMGSLFWLLTYDPEYDGFWLGQDWRTMLYNRHGQKIKSSPTAPGLLFGSGYYVAKDGNPHLLLLMESQVCHYDINNDFIFDNPLFTFDGNGVTSFGVCTGEYDGKDAFYFAVDNTLCIYEIKSLLAQIIGYRLYRTDSEGNVLMLADDVSGSSYIDTTWTDLSAGVYRFGISSVFANGIESEIVWSDTLVKTDHGIDEINDHDVCLYPNPVNDKLIVECSRPILQCDVFTLDGKLVHSRSCCSNRIEIQTGLWSPGTYIIHLHTAAFEETRRFVIQKK